MATTDPQGAPAIRPQDEKLEKSPNQTDTATDTESANVAITPDPAAPLSALSPAPDGGPRAWLVVSGAACIFFSCLGFMNSFGVFQAYYMTHQLRDQPADNIAWIGSLTAFIQFAGGAISGPLFDRFGAWVIRPGAVLYVFALMMTSISKQYWHFMLAQGVLTGFAMSLLQVPAFAAVAQYFDKKRAAALGIVVSGSSIGGVVFPIALSKMLNSSSLGFGWSVRVMGFLVIPLLGFSCFAIQARLPPRNTSFFIAQAFREIRFLMIVAAGFCCFIGMFTPLFFIPSYAVFRGIDATFASYLLAIVNAASTFGRIIPGMLADRFGKLNMFAIGGLFTGIIGLCMNTATNTAGLVVYSIAFGFSSGTIISGASAAFSICTDDPRNLGTYMGMGMAMASCASLLGPPVDGVMLEKYHGFLQATIFSGVICVAGGVLAFATKATTKEGLFGRS
ncbi:major facilitator superfamily domain-containing protein [Staphylotrichum tortipilum]|uniref:Major facilitator superfamily domain-containing protein n=1 Tax=Staphylotrichum tortipilum TaxID=2831512 RepID=A0AAN6MPV8_9PEZI|nr:major facilitator superfamily domain-containing protein [Staphylotrichum longicolle]